MSNQNIYKTAALVTSLSVAERFLGFLYRIILSRTIGSEGMGLYQIALSVFAVLVTAVSSGIPVTLSRVITKHKADGDKIGEGSTVSAAVILTLALAVPVFCLFFFGYDLFGFMFSDERCESIFVIMLFGLVFTSVYAVIRGSFWGNKQFIAYSLIELIEECVMIVLGTILVLGSTNALSGARRAAFAIVISYITSFAIALIYFFVKGGKFYNPKGEYKPLLSSSVPITAMRTSSSLINSLIAVIMPLRLISFGMTKTQALSEFGVAFGMVMPVLSVPSTIIGSISLVLVPELSENFYKNQHELLKKNIERAVKTTSVIACIIFPFMLVFGKDAGTIIYSNPKSGEMIANSCLILLPMSITMITTSMLNSLHLETKTLIYFLIGSAAMLLCIYFLSEYFGIYSLIVGMVADYIICSVLNLRLLNKTCICKPKYLKHMTTTFLSSLFISVFGNILYSLTDKIMSAAPSITITATVMTIITAVLFKTFDVITYEEFKKLFNNKPSLVDRKPEKI